MANREWIKERYRAMAIAYFKEAMKLGRLTDEVVRRFPGATEVVKLGRQGQRTYMRLARSHAEQAKGGSR